MANLMLDEVSKVYRSRGKASVRAVDRINMTVEDGEIVGLLGSSGCGKTSTLRMIAGFEDVTEGTIRIGETVINELAPARRNVAMAFEGYALYPPLRIRDNIGFALLRDRHPRAEVEAKVKEVAGLLEIDDILDRFPPTISAGEQQRTSLARALIRDAALFLLDEPMSQLEPQLRAVLRARIKDWLIERRMTTVFVTHDQTEAIALADRIAVLEEGVLQQCAAPETLKSRPANLFVASFIGEPPMNLFAARARREGGELSLSVSNERGQVAFDLALPSETEAPRLHARIEDGAELRLGIRPHHVGLGEPNGGLKAEVASNQWLGDQTHIGVDLEGCSLIAVAEGSVTARAGETVGVALTPNALHLFDAESGAALFHGLEPAGVEEVAS